ncbi:Cytochrome c oxidase polypeptide II [Rhodovastum atsumiense]|uniref:cytochrome-c oxidase n=1 Tax=Rhodovastum atsumiense TaxID=504468 RepID=A0A5M6IY17_9PROT|nr:cytochrome c oxidase subunit II [Rhodovastum atsumiense]KAA5613246.1 cytochrome c oxidase subunit II [Rhodovastum atsumiense]CAH2600596.1 Cytochrome c oxidase polypeptide II [Rhodovastum atsumiense]
MNPLLLVQGSNHAPELDLLFGALLLITAAVLLLAFGLIWTYVIRYRASNPLDRGGLAQKTWRMEVAWTTATLLVFFGLFIWGADLYTRLFLPPEDTLKVWVVGKQWMWKVQHPGGQREINALHVPVNRPVQLIMTSEDVIHDFFIPGFRIKRDVLPGRYTTLWFRADRLGSYHLFCAQFCGTDHSRMIGEVIVMEPADFDIWLAENGGGATLAEAGQGLFIRYGCSGCHGGRSSVHAPPLEGVYGSPVPLSDGSVVVADDRYIHDSILYPGAQVAAGYAPLMPSFAGQIIEEDLVKLVAYIRSLAGARPVP